MKTPEQFIYWLSGFFELHEENLLTEAQVKRIKTELNAIFAEPTKLYASPPLNVPSGSFIPPQIPGWTPTR